MLHPPNVHALAAFTLNFNRRVKRASVKNVQLTMWEFKDDVMGEKVVLQFGRLDEDSFILDFGYPFSAETAFAFGEHCM